MRKKADGLLFFVTFLSIISISFALGGIVSHTTSEIQQGTFLGNYSFLNGNFGIGTTTPTALLHIYGTNKDLKITESDGGGRFWVTDGGNLVIDNVVPTNDIYVGNSGPTDILLATGGGSVGIGITDPTSKLHVIGDIYASNGIVQGNASAGVYSNSYGTTNGGSTIMQFTGAPSGDMVFTTGGSEVVRLKSNGNVGIRTTEPQNPLDVYGNGNTPGLRISNTNAASSQWVTIHENGAMGIFNVGNTQNDQYGSFLFTSTNNANTVNRMIIDYLGNVGIGTLTPTEKLTVNGSLKVDGPFIVRNPNDGTKCTKYVKYIDVPSNSYYTEQISVETYYMITADMALYGNGGSGNIVASYLRGGYIGAIENTIERGAPYKSTGDVIISSDITLGKVYFNVTNTHGGQSKNGYFTYEVCD